MLLESETDLEKELQSFYKDAKNKHLFPDAKPDEMSPETPETTQKEKRKRNGDCDGTAKVITGFYTILEIYNKNYIQTNGNFMSISESPKNVILLRP